MSPTNIKRIVLAIAMLFFLFTLLHANWLAPDPVGKLQLVATGPADIPRNADGCIIDPKPGYDGRILAAEARMLQSAAGYGADGIIIDSEVADSKAILPRILAFTCPADRARPRAPVAEAVGALGRPVQYIRVKDAAHAKAVIPAISDNGTRQIFFGSTGGIAALKAGRPDIMAFSIAAARQCAAAYRAGGWYGKVPDSCRGKFMLLTLDDIGYMLWGWPDRFLDRMAKNDVRVMIAERVEGGEIKGLARPEQYGEIAHGFNGVIFVGDIAEMGPALKR